MRDGTQQHSSNRRYPASKPHSRVHAHWVLAAILGGAKNQRNACGWCSWRQWLTTLPAAPPPSSHTQGVFFLFLTHHATVCQHHGATLQIELARGGVPAGARREQSFSVAASWSFEAKHV